MHSYRPSYSIYFSSASLFHANQCLVFITEVLIGFHWKDFSSGVLCLVTYVVPLSRLMPYVPRDTRIFGELVNVSDLPLDVFIKVGP